MSKSFQESPSQLRCQPPLARGPRNSCSLAPLAKGGGTAEGGGGIPNRGIPFYNEEYTISPSVFVPRFDTERVVDRLIELLPLNGTFLDLCTGSGCIAISTLAARKDCTADAVDIVDLDIARINAEANGVSDRVNFIQADIKTFKADSYDIIVSNPPYIRSDVIPTLDLNDPYIALDGGSDGMDFYRLILNRYKPKHYYIFEIGYDQAEQIKALCDCIRKNCGIYKDYGGNDRVAVITCSNFV